MSVPSSDPSRSARSSSRNRAGHRRVRRGDLFLTVAGAVVVVAAFLVWTGVAPTPLYSQSPSQWTVEVPTCNGTAVYVDHAFPLWATVHLSWTAKGGAVWYMVEARGTTYVSGTGTNGSGSFVSDSYPFSFWAISLLSQGSPTCSPIQLITTVTYSL